LQIVSVIAFFGAIAYRDKKVVGVFVRFRAPLPVTLIKYVVMAYLFFCPNVNPSEQIH
jgi:hypothetical protein